MSETLEKNISSFALFFLARYDNIEYKMELTEDN